MARWRLSLGFLPAARARLLAGATLVSDRIVKEGWCKQCSRSDIGVSWHPASRAWYCTDCWPALRENKQQEKRESKIPTERELSRLRDTLYGIRIEDDPHEPEHSASFVVICPEHGVIGDDLWLTPARQLRDNHELEHPVA
jgi:hypothetical protein